MSAKETCSGSTVYELFLHSLDPSAEIRRQSEQMLDSVSTNDGFLPHLIQLICAPQCEPHLKQAMVIYFKNKVNRFWETQEGVKGLSRDDKTFIKANILNIVSTCDIPFIRIQLLISLKAIIKFDFPSEWPELLNEISMLLQSSRMHSLLTGLEAFLRLISIQNYENNDSRHAIIEKLFPIILGIAKGTKAHQTELGIDVLKIILKIFHTGIKYSLPDGLQEEVVLSEWIALILDVLSLPCPSSFAILEENSSEVEKKLFWKMKKWACHCLNTLFCRYGSNNDEFIVGKLRSGFQKMFMAKFSTLLVQFYLNMVEQHCSEAQSKITNRMVCLCCDFLSQAIKPKSTWNQMQSRLEMLVTKFIFPQCCFSDQDEALWNDDPTEFIREKLNPFSEVYDPISACSNLLIDLAKTRKKIVFSSILSFLNAILTRYLATPAKSRNAREKDGALYMVGCLNHLIEGTPIHNEMEAFLVAHVLPELQSEFPFLRARACWIFQQFSSIHFANPKNAHYAWEGVSQCMSDADLPVRVEAALAIGSLLEYDIVKESMRSYAGQIMQVLMNLTTESDSDALSYVMDQLVEIFPEEIAPFSANIIAQLSGTIMQSLENYTPYSTDGFDDAEDENLNPTESDKIVAMIGLFKTILNIIDSVKSNPTVLAQIEQIMNPLIVTVLNKEVIDLYDDTFAYLESITFALKTISPDMWRIYELVCAAFQRNASDFLENMSSFFDNVVSYGTEVFLSVREYQSMLFEIIQFSIFNEDSWEYDKIHPCKLIESILLNCKGKVDYLLPKFIQFAIHLLKTELHTVVGRVSLVQLPINCILYNAQMSVSCLEQLDGLVLVFTKWFEFYQLFKRVHDKKLCVLAINEILKLSFDSLPPALQSGYSKLMIVAAEMLDTLPEAYKKRREELEEYLNGTNADADVVCDQEVEEDEDIEYDSTEHLSATSTDEPEFIGFDDDEEGDELFDDLEEEPFFQTPLDSIDPFQTMHATLRHIQDANAPAFAQLLKDLGEGQKKRLEATLSFSQAQFEAPQK